VYFKASDFGLFRSSQSEFYDTAMLYDLVSQGDKSQTSVQTFWQNKTTEWDEYQQGELRQGQIADGKFHKNTIPDLSFPVYASFRKVFHAWTEAQVFLFTLMMMMMIVQTSYEFHVILTLIHYRDKGFLVLTFGAERRDPNLCVTKALRLTKMYVLQRLSTDDYMPECDHCPICKDRPHGIIIDGTSQTILSKNAEDLRVHS
jgi:hypothetical protein